jgi:hypothetical protein
MADLHLLLIRTRLTSGAAYCPMRQTSSRRSLPSVSSMSPITSSWRTLPL